MSKTFKIKYRNFEASIARAKSQAPEVPVLTVTYECAVFGEALSRLDSALHPETEAIGPYFIKILFLFLLVPVP